MTVSNKEELNILREGGRKLAAVLEQVKREVKPGIKTKDLDLFAEKLIRTAGGEPSFKGYRVSGVTMSYPASLCISINDEVVHGIPSERELKEGDLVGLDIGMKYPANSAGRQGLFTDMAETVGVSNVDEIGRKLIQVTKEALELAVSKVRSGVRVGDVGEAVQNFIESEKFGVVRELVGHGVGKKVHEDPEIPNWGRRGTGSKLVEGMVIAIEPMVTEGDYKLYLADDGWTWKTKDGKRAAHFEHSMVVTKNGVEILTEL